MAYALSVGIGIIIMRRDFLQVRVKSVFLLGHCQEMAVGQRFTALTNARLWTEVSSQSSAQLQRNTTFDQQVLGLLLLFTNSITPSLPDFQYQKKVESRSPKTGPAKFGRTPNKENFRRRHTSKLTGRDWLGSAILDAGDKYRDAQKFRTLSAVGPQV